MKANVGSADRLVRFVAGLGLIFATLAGVVGGWGWLGIVLLLTAGFGFCPAYLPFSLSTCRKSKQSSREINQ